MIQNNWNLKDLNYKARKCNIFLDVIILLNDCFYWFYYLTTKIHKHWIGSYLENLMHVRTITCIWLFKEFLLQINCLIDCKLISTKENRMVFIKTQRHLFFFMNRLVLKQDQNHKWCSHEHASVGQPAKTYIHQLCTDAGCRLEDFPRAMINRWIVKESREYLSV